MTIKTYFPKEHGAWAILVLPYFIGMAIGGGLTGKGILGLFGIILLFLSRKPLLLLLKERFLKERTTSSNRKNLYQSIFLFSITGTIVFLWLLIKYRLWEIIIIGLMALFLLLVHTYFVLSKKERTVAGEILGVCLLTLTAPLGAILSGTDLTREVLILWFLNILYFSGSIFYIKMRKKAVLARKGPLNFPFNINLVKECLAYIFILVIVLALLVANKIVPVLVFLAFIPMMVHTLWSILVLRPKFEIFKQGFIQMGLSLIYSVLLVIFWK